MKKPSKREKFARVLLDASNKWCERHVPGGVRSWDDLGDKHRNAYLFMAGELIKMGVSIDSVSPEADVRCG